MTPDPGTSTSTRSPLINGLTVAVGAAELLRQTLRSLRDEAPKDPPRLGTFAVGATELTASFVAERLSRTAVAVDSISARIPARLGRPFWRPRAAEAWRDTAASRGGEILSAGKDEAARMVTNGIDAILPWIADELVPRLLDAIRPYLAQEVVPSLIDDLMPYLTEELVPKIVVELMPTLRSDILPVVIGDLAASDELRDLIRNQSQGFVRETGEEVKERTRHADDIVEDRVRRLLRLRLRDRIEDADVNDAVSTDVGAGSPS